MADVQQMLQQVQPHPPFLFVTAYYWLEEALQLHANSQAHSALGEHFDDACL